MKKNIVYILLGIFLLARKMKFLQEKVICL